MRTMILAALLATAMPAAAWAEPADVAASVAATSARSEANVKLDESRKPAQLLTFLGLEKGMKVADMFGINQYWSEIIAPAVGPDGSVVVWEPTQFANPKRLATFAEFTARQPNVVLTYSPFETPVLSQGAFDFMLINLDYHDVYWESAENKVVKMDPDAWLRSVYAAMKPGGIVGVVDHVANAGGDTREVVNKLHRIDPAVVKADFERAGFTLEASSDLLANPADDHSLLVFDQAIRGKTDRFVYKFRKPR